MINSLKEIRIFDKRVRFYDHVKSFSVTSIASELSEEYNLDKININDGDVIIDIGSHVGVVSTYLSMANPNCKIYSFEPSYNTFHCLQKNIEMNNVKNVKIHNLAVTSDGRDVTMRMPINNTGGSSFIFGQNNFHYVNTIKSIDINTLFENVLKETGVDRIKMLKIDCEGAEYEILRKLKPQYFSKIEFLIGEFHSIKDDEFNTPKNLYDFSKQYVKEENIKVRFL